MKQIVNCVCIRFSVTVPGYQTNMLAAVVQSANVAPWERFGVEFILTFMVVFVYFVCMDTYRKWLTSSCLTIGATYAACTFVSVSRLLLLIFKLSCWPSQRKHLNFFNLYVKVLIGTKWTIYILKHIYYIIYKHNI